MLRCSPVGPYFSNGFKSIKILADSRYVRAWPGGAGECKCGGWATLDSTNDDLSKVILALIISHLSFVGIMVSSLIVALNTVGEEVTVIRLRIQIEYGNTPVKYYNVTVIVISLFMRFVCLCCKNYNTFLGKLFFFNLSMFWSFSRKTPSFTTSNILLASFNSLEYIGVNWNEWSKVK